MQVKALGQEVLTHLYEVVGTDAVLKAFNAARRNVLDRRQTRRVRQAVQVRAILASASMYCVCKPAFVLFRNLS